MQSCAKLFLKQLVFLKVNIFFFDQDQSKNEPKIHVLFIVNDL